MSLSFRRIVERMELVGYLRANFEGGGGASCLCGQGSLLRASIHAKFFVRVNVTQTLVMATVRALAIARLIASGVEGVASFSPFPKQPQGHVSASQTKARRII